MAYGRDHWKLNKMREECSSGETLQSRIGKKPVPSGFKGEQCGYRRGELKQSVDLKMLHFMLTVHNSPFQNQAPFIQRASILSIVTASRGYTSRYLEQEDTNGSS